MNDVREEVGGEALSACPICGYSLKGLPAEYVCPECGFEYDGSMRVWRGKKNALISPPTLVIIYALITVVTGGNYLTTGSGSLGDVLLWPFLLVVSLVMLRGSPLIVVGKCGLVLSRVGDRPRYWDWSEVRKAWPHQVSTAECSFLGRTWRMPLSSLQAHERNEVIAYLKQMAPPEKLQSFGGD